MTLLAGAVPVLSAFALAVPSAWGALPAPGQQKCHLLQEALPSSLCASTAFSHFPVKALTRRIVLIYTPVSPPDCGLLEFRDRVG